MSKQPISVTLDSDNITWLKGRAGAAGYRSVSDLLDQLVSQARQSGSIGPSRSVIGTIDIDPSDPLLAHADEYVRALFDKSVGRLLRVKESTAEYRVSPRPTKRRG